MNENLIITPAEVVSLAFAPTNHVRTAQITEVEILAAQQKYLAPVFGRLWERLCAGEYTDFANEYIKPALAQYVKARTLPSLASVTASGVVQHISATTKRATDDDLLRTVRAVYDTAATLRRRAIEYVESNPQQFPEYDRSQNILNHTRIESGVVL